MSKLYIASARTLGARELQLVHVGGLDSLVTGTGIFSSGSLAAGTRFAGGVGLLVTSFQAGYWVGTQLYNGYCAVAYK